MRNLSLASLRGLSDKERNRTLSALVAETRRAPNADDFAAVNRRIAAFEAEHGMSSETMQQRLNAGEIGETYAVCQWLMALEMRRHLESLR